VSEPAEQRRRVLVVTWAPGGNLPPLLAAARLMGARGHHVQVLASAATRPFVERAGLGVLAYRRGPEPDTRTAFELQADAMMATAAGPELESEVGNALAGARPDLAIVDCMLPAGLAAARATGTPAAALVHFLLGPTGRGTAGGWMAGLLSAWEHARLVLVTAPRWLDAGVDHPANAVHAGPLGVATSGRGSARRPRRVLLSFSTTVMDGQLPALQRVCDALGGSEADAFLTLGPAIDPGSLRIPANVDAVPWADHDELLPACAAMIGHGGLGTTLRALAHGVPQVLVPLGRDQALNADRVAELGAGIALAAGSPPAGIGAALNRVLAEPGFARAAAAAAARISADEPDLRAVAALERCFPGR
jgi:UDP:flavonoid glycosyltransferase YjiC (YdhE family)